MTLKIKERTLHVKNVAGGAEELAADGGMCMCSYGLAN